MFLWCFVSTCAHTSSIKYLPSLSVSGSIVSVGDPKKKYTRFEKIGQGWVYICDHESTLHSYWNRAISGAASLPPRDGGSRDGRGGGGYEVFLTTSLTRRLRDRGRLGVNEWKEAKRRGNEWILKWPKANSAQLLPLLLSPPLSMY